jgi:hypothetical protein
MNAYYYENCYAQRGAPLAQKEKAASVPMTINAALFPNPAEKSTTLRYSAEKSQPLVMEVRNLTGQVVARREVMARAGVNDVEVDLAKASAGLHVVTLQAGGRVIYRSKLTVAK